MQLESVGIILAERYLPLADLVCRLLQDEVGLEPPRRTLSGGETLELLSGDSPDLLILDSSLPDLPGLDLISLVLERVPTARIIVLNDPDEPRYAQAALRRGAAACLARDHIGAELLPTVRAVLSSAVTKAPTTE